MIRTNAIADGQEVTAIGTMTVTSIPANREQVGWL